MNIAVFGNIDAEEEGDVVINYNIHDFQFNGKYDRILTSLTIPELPRDKVMDFLEKCYEGLVPFGEFVVHVPMAEYACKQIFTNSPDHVTFYALYGNDSNPFRCCYSLLAMRTLMERAKFVIRSANSGTLTIQTSTETNFLMPVHILIATKLGE
jgi:hypothetical protein